MMKLIYSSPFVKVVKVATFKALMTSATIGGSTDNFVEAEENTESFGTEQGSY